MKLDIGNLYFLILIPILAMLVVAFEWILYKKGN